MLELRHLALLREVAARGSLAAAAQAMSYTPSAASQQLQRLEREIGLPLVRRGPRRATLTPAGSRLLAHAADILGRVAAAEADMHALAGGFGGGLRVAVFPSAGATLMPPAIGRFAVDHPEVQLTLVETETGEALAHLERREVDLAIGYDFEVDPRLPRGGSRLALLDDEMHLALAHDHPLAQQDCILLADLRREAWIASRSDAPCSAALIATCTAAGFQPHVVYRSDDYATVQQLVAAGIGISVVPGLAVDRRRRDVLLRATEPALPARRVFAAVADDGPPAASAMAAILASVSAGAAFAPHTRRGSDVADPSTLTFAG